MPLKHNPRHISWAVVIFSAQGWFLRFGITEAKNSTLGGKEHNVLSQYGFCNGCPNLNRDEDGSFLNKERCKGEC